MGDDDKYDELFLSYVAGFFDGEGSIYIQKSKLRKKHHQEQRHRF